jgi:surface antigen
MGVVSGIVGSTFVTGVSPGPADFRLGYSRSGRTRLWRLVCLPFLGVVARRLAGASPAAAIAGTLLGVAACTTPGQLGSLFAHNDLGDITGAADAGPLGDVSLRLNGDLAMVRTTAAAMLEQEGLASAPWQNPATGAHGTVTRVAAAYDQGGRQCREFLASYLRGKTEAWLQGNACRDGFGNWEVRELRPGLGA